MSRVHSAMIQVTVLAFALIGALCNVVVNECDEACSDCTQTAFAENVCSTSSDIAGYGSTKYACTNSVTFCAAVAVYATSACDQAEIARVNPVCNICQYDWEADAYFKLDCNLVTNHVAFREGCDSTCNNCSNVAAYPAGGCLLDRSTDSFVLNEGIFQCQSFSQSFWTGTGCSGAPSFTHVDSLNHCDDGKFFQCSVPPTSISAGAGGLISKCSDETCGNCATTEFADHDCLTAPAIDGVASFKLDCLPVDTCADVFVYETSDCSAVVAELHPVCNLCQFDWEAGSYFKLECNLETNHLNFREGCNAACENCSNVAAYPKGDCLLDQSTGGFVRSSGFSPCSTFRQKIWNTSVACHGSPTYEHVDSQFHCDGSIIVDCRARTSSPSNALSPAAKAGIAIGVVGGLGTAGVIAWKVKAAKAAQRVTLGNQENI